MQVRLVLLLFTILLTACSSKYFIVRHAEKAQVSAGTSMQTTNDPPLTEVGQVRAQALKDRLSSEKIGTVFSTNTIRTISTAQPAATHFNQDIKIYAKADSAFIRLLKAQKGNVLIVGHSNTVDEIVNGLTGRQQLTDLPDSEYDNIFVVKKRGKKYSFKAERFGAAAH